MKIAIASDKAGFFLKEKLIEYLSGKRYEIADVGLKDADGYMSFFDASDNLVKRIINKEAERGILICGTGAGMCLNANRYKGIFAVACESIYSAKMCRIINDANVLTMGANIVGPGLAIDMCDAFLKTSFTQSMPAERVEYLKKLKSDYMDFLSKKEF
jgi:ribose 5-phosphate isomerase B